MYRLNRLVIDEMERTAMENADLVRTWAGAPADIGGFTNELLSALTRRTRRRMELGRTLFDDLRDMGAGTRSLWERMTDANRQTALATVRAGRETLSDAARTAADAAETVSERADGAAEESRGEARRANPQNN
jgi:hypothetical protein